MTDVSTEIDRIDRQIIEVLRKDGRMTWTELATTVHLAPSSAAERVRRLERAGVIRGYRAQIDPVSLGLSVRAVIEVALRPGADAEGFETRLRHRPEVTFAAYVTGDSDYSVLVECHGAEGLDGIVRWLRNDEAVARTVSRFMLRVVHE
jgi:Lrp/AsnC family leucine-responsive transcriptional regulator